MLYIFKSFGVRSIKKTSPSLYNFYLINHSWNKRNIHVYLTVVLYKSKRNLITVTWQEKRERMTTGYGTAYYSTGKCLWQIEILWIIKEWRLENEASFSGIFTLLCWSIISHWKENVKVSFSCFLFLLFCFYL